MDRIIKSGSGTGDHDLRPHNFLPLQDTVSSPKLTSLDAAAEGFKRGLVGKQNSCPTLSGMEAMLSSRSASDQQAADVSEGLESDYPDSEQEPLAVACILERFGEAHKGLQGKRDAIYERAAEETVKLALAISEKIINHEVRIDSSVVLGLVRKAMQKIKESQHIFIRVSPEDLETLKQTDLETTFEGLAFQADGAMGRGDCLIETRQGNIDATIRNQLAVIEEAFASLAG